VATHPIVHIEIPARDTKAAGKFYADTFGWNMRTDPTFDYTMFQVEGGPGGGFVSAGQTIDPRDPNAHRYDVGKVLVYIGTDDIDASLRAVEANGGKTLKGKTEIPGVGWFAVFSDPSGNTVALFTDAQSAS
jgi:predicted enzyme related to lactoylglutathione lyase